MIGRTFRALRDFYIDEPLDTLEKQSRYEGLRVDLPAYTILKLGDIPVTHLHFLSCPNLQTLRFQYPRVRNISHEAVLKALQDV